jgi:nucleoporin POM152
VLRKPVGRGEKAVKQSKTIQILKTSGALPMQTLEPGEYIYTIHSMNDHIYNIPSTSGLLNSQRSGDIQIKQEVLASPQGVLSILPRTTYCVEESLSGQTNKGVKIELTGKAPFEVDIEVKNQVTQIAETFKLRLESKSSLLNIPYKFSSASPHSIKIQALEDSNQCKSVITVPQTLTVSDNPKGQNSASLVTLEVAEIASIKPINDKSYYCVGENLEFLLKGSAPWLIKYEFNGRESKININSQSQSKFSRLAQEPGLFKLLEISSSSSASSKDSSHYYDHSTHNDVCNSKLNFERAIKPLPVAKISSGRYFIEDIREGDQVELLFFFFLVVNN